jgi:hypothetical protein
MRTVEAPAPDAGDTMPLQGPPALTSGRMQCNAAAKVVLRLKAFWCDGSAMHL